MPAAGTLPRPAHRHVRSSRHDPNDAPGGLAARSRSARRRSASARSTSMGGARGSTVQTVAGTLLTSTIPTPEPTSWVMIGATPTPQRTARGHSRRAGPSGSTTAPGYTLRPSTTAGSTWPCSSGARSSGIAEPGGCPTPGPGAPHPGLLQISGAEPASPPSQSAKSAATRTTANRAFVDSCAAGAAAGVDAACHPRRPGR